MSPLPTPATASTGFFQPAPTVLNQWTDDAALARAVTLFLSDANQARASPTLQGLGGRVLSPQVLAAFVDAETHPPHLKGEGYSAFGAPATGPDALVTSAGWKFLQSLGLREGIVATGHELGVYEGQPGAERIVQLLKVYLWSASSAMVVCPSGMQDGAVACLGRELRALPDAKGYSAAEKKVRKRVFESALSHLLSRDTERAWTSGQWMTERIGGSDVRGTQTVATLAADPTAGGVTDTDGLPLGPWSVSGFKFFSSATDCGCAIILAYTQSGLSCFFGPTQVLDPTTGEVKMNGIRIVRLKNKLGTHALPTAELELTGMRAHLLGEEGRGVAVIANVLNVARFHNSARAVGYLGRGLGVARAFARVRRFPSRTAKGSDDLLRDIPLFARTLSAVTLRHRADTLLATFLAGLLGAVEASQRGTPEPTAVATPHGIIPTSVPRATLLLRLLTSVCKAYITKHSVAGLQECMEALGGIGYLENNETPSINVACMYRDANVFCIWEGTTDVLSTDTVKVLRGKSGAAVTQALGDWLNDTLGKDKTVRADLEEPRRGVLDAFAAIQRMPKPIDDLMPMAREVVKRVGDVVCAALLVLDAQRDGDAVAGECARRFVVGEMGVRDAREERQSEVTRWDRRIAFEGEGRGEVGARL